jgi:hypothetical protein
MHSWAIMMQARLLAVMLRLVLIIKFVREEIVMYIWGHIAHGTYRLRNEEFQKKRTGTGRRGRHITRTFSMYVTAEFLEESDPEFVNVYRAQESLPKNRFRQPTVAWRAGTTNGVIITGPPAT